MCAGPVGTPRIGGSITALSGGRHIARDGYVDGYNLYQYVQSNPIGATDPSGLVICKCATTNWSATGYGGGAWTGRPSYSSVPNAAACNAKGGSASSIGAGSASGSTTSCTTNLGNMNPLLNLCAGDPNPKACEEELINYLNGVKEADDRALGTWEGWWEERGYGPYGGRCHLWSGELGDHFHGLPAGYLPISMANEIITLDGSDQWEDHNINVIQNSNTGQCIVIDDGFWGGLGQAYDPCKVNPPLLGPVGQQQWQAIKDKCGCGK